MYKIHEWSDKEPTAFVSDGKLWAQKTIKITDGVKIDGIDRIICETRISNAGYCYHEVAEAEAFINDLLRLHEYKAAWIEHQKIKEAIEYDKRTDAQREFEAWAGEGAIHWITQDETSREVRFHHWVNTGCKFIDTLGDEWYAYGHGFDADPNGGHWDKQEDF